jgi:UDP-N-acetylenolpyruvoylglucosamine reductase
VKLDVPLGPYCTFRTGGRARLFAEPATEAEAIRIVRAMQRRGVPVIPVGGGSNLLFAGARIDACVLATRRLRGAEAVSETRLRVLAGDGLQGTLRLAERHGLAGLEPFAGIPGTVGGAVFGNAGGAVGAVGDVVARVRLLEADGTVAWHGKERLGARYRHTDLDGALVLAIELELRPDDPDAIRARRLAATRKKGATQPLDARSAGCFFKNPPGESAGRLIDQCGLKGLRRGGASVSTVHANFVVNDGDATPEDVLAVVAEVQRVVRATRGIDLVPEVKLIR